MTKFGSYPVLRIVNSASRLSMYKYSILYFAIHISVHDSLKEMNPMVAFTTIIITLFSIDSLDPIVFTPSRSASYRWQSHWKR